LRGQAIRSNGAIPYEGYAEFEQAVMMLLEDPALADEMGASGRSYVEQQYEWKSVIGNVELTLEIAKAQFKKRSIMLSRG
jgi:glycosyltransferase involved in cell wall biosynthesis